MQEIKNLYNWLFHYNYHREEWTAFHRDDYSAYWNNEKPIHRMYKNKLFNKVISQLYEFELKKE